VLRCDQFIRQLPVDNPCMCHNPASVLCRLRTCRSRQCTRLPLGSHGVLHVDYEDPCAVVMVCAGVASYLEVLSWSSQVESQGDAVGFAGRPCLHQVLDWYNLVAASAAGGVPFCDEQRSVAIGSCPGRQCLSWWAVPPLL
jgi:hypothetical protein